MFDIVILLRSHEKVFEIVFITPRIYINRLRNVFCLSFAKLFFKNLIKKCIKIVRYKLRKISNR